MSKIDPTVLTVEERRNLVCYYVEDCGMSFADIGRLLKVTRQRARAIYLDAGEPSVNGGKWAEIDPKGVLPPRLRGTLKRLGLTAKQAVEVEVWNHERGFGDASRVVLIRHYS